MKKTITLIFLGALVCLNCSGCLLAAGAAGAEAGYVATQKNRTVGETLDDQGTSTSIKTQLLADPDVSGLAINVDVERGVATLRGYVKTQREINRAIEIARTTKGVKRVDSRLVLDPK